jgi:hypothetical protein
MMAVMGFYQMTLPRPLTALSPYLMRRPVQEL